ncbi:unnamed protein product [Calicophoron daubneyi]|uniref:AN1-type zinc finger protein 4 n=1 Tax=Calicophoron daubneyi TaxID=300641 RepID=A0AAV2U1W8_CALDB
MLMDLFIETLTGVSFELRVSPVETVMSIKSKIQRAEGIPVTQQHLIWQNGELDDHRRLRDYSICGGSTLRLVLGLRGGPLNAHRIPPLRLTPIQLTPSLPPAIFTRLEGGPSGTARITNISRVTLPTLAAQGIPPRPPQNPHSPDSTGKVPDGLDPLKAAVSDSASVEISKNLTNLPEPNEEQNVDTKVAIPSEVSGVSKPNSDSKSPSSVENISPKASVISCDSLKTSAVQMCSNPTVLDDQKRPKLTKNRKQTPEATDEDSPDTIGHSTSDIHKSPAASVPLEISNRISRTRGLARSMDDVPKVAPTDLNSNSQSMLKLAPVPVSAQKISEYNVDHSNAEEKNDRLSPPLDYPPLLQSPGTLRRSLNPLEVPSYWRIYESRGGIQAVSHSSVIRNPLPPVGSTEHDSDSSRPGTGSDHGSSKLRFLKPEVPKSAEEADDFPLSSAGPSAAAAAATLLAGLLSATGSDLPCQTSGTEREYSHPRYPYHWLRRNSPLLEENELPPTVVATGNFWDTDETEDDCDAVAGNLFELDTEHDDDDLDEEDDLVELKGDYAYGLDDDDSLADLEDYLFYYRTGDLLFGPPSLTTGYSPYSYYALRDVYTSDRWRSELENDLSGGTVPDGKTTNTKCQGGTSWQQERSQMVEKVKDLKARMKELRVRRQARHRNADSGIQGKEVPSSEPPISECKEYSPLNQPAVNASNEPTSTQHDAVERPPVPTILPPVDLSNPHAVHSSTTCPTSAVRQSVNSSIAGSSGGEPERRQRQRRFGTVTPPELSMLMQQAAYSDALSELSRRDRVNSALRPFASNPTLPSTNIEGDLKDASPSTTSSIPPRLARRPLSSVVQSSDSLLKHSSLPLTNASLSSDESNHRVSPSFSARCAVNGKPPHSRRSTVVSRPVPTGRPRTSAVTSNATSLFFPSIVGSGAAGLVACSANTARLSLSGEGRLRVSSRMGSSGGTAVKLVNGKSDSGQSVVRALLPSGGGKVDTLVIPRSPPKTTHSPTSSVRRKRCAVCFRKTGIVNSYTCRCGRNFCARHRYAEAHACPFDYKAEARRTLLDANPVVTAPKLPKI